MKISAKCLARIIKFDDNDNGNTNGNAITYKCVIQTRSANSDKLFSTIIGC